MLYKEFAPRPELATYIDAYWSVQGIGQTMSLNKILPDGCVDIILNLGEALGDMKSGNAYLIGAMTTPIENRVSPETKLMGVRFKPAGFWAFYQFSSLHEITDTDVELEKMFVPEIFTDFERGPARGQEKNAVGGLNKFFMNRLSRPKHALFPLLEDIRKHNGLIRVEELAKRHFITPRQLERQFRYYIGISPKEFLNQERFRSTLQRVRSRRPGESLTDIAFECGYYDHSHLTQEIKRYTGEAPSELR
jgi:AraC-like DNA-binding protein